MPDATLRTLTVYFDYTCRYSYRALHWLDRVRSARPGFEVVWKTFSLKEVNREESEASWVAADAPSSISVLALALAHAARDADFDRYHHAVFEAMHGEERKLAEEDLIAIAADARVDAERFAAERARWIASVGEEHLEAVERLGVYGTPTLVFDRAGVYLRLTDIPSTEAEALGLLDSLGGVTASRVNLVEVFPPPEPQAPAQLQIGSHP